MYVDVLSHFDAIHERNRQTDGQTDGQKSYINISRQHCCVSSAVVAVNAVVTDPSPSSLVQVSPSHPSVELPCSLWQSVVRVCMLKPIDKLLLLHLRRRTMSCLMCSVFVVML